jgi:hypothetical protein
MFCVGGGVVLVTGLDVTVVGADVAGAFGADGAALGFGPASLAEHPLRATTRTSANPPMATGRGLTTGDSIIPEPAISEEPQ